MICWDCSIQYSFNQVKRKKYSAEQRYLIIRYPCYCIRFKTYSMCGFNMKVKVDRSSCTHPDVGNFSFRIVDELFVTVAEQEQERGEQAGHHGVCTCALTGADCGLGWTAFLLSAAGHFKNGDEKRARSVIARPENISTPCVFHRAIGVILTRPWNEEEEGWTSPSRTACREPEKAPRGRGLPRLKYWEMFSPYSVTERNPGLDWVSKSLWLKIYKSKTCVSSLLCCRYIKLGRWFLTSSSIHPAPSNQWSALASPELRCRRGAHNFLFQNHASSLPCRTDLVPP